MTKATDYVLGQSAQAACQLAIQDQLLAEPAQMVFDELALRQDDWMVEFG